ncbi:MAG: ParB/RepB/Spo0J family partition protein [Clostridia bacterium]|nr:ParB/RepB/Spo0J family partition protein [Clostridia bacterium]MBQ5489061.1 ParB/RepB/Spo0J family partition protein [Clostridia bacterium]
MKGLGKGLEALLGNSSNIIEENTVNTVSVYLIDTNADQPRKVFDDEKLKELADSIEQHGVIQPIIVQKAGERYRIIAGERRFRAARLAGLNEVPVIVRDLNEQEVLEVSLIENLQRENLNAIEEARAIKALIDEHDLKQEDVAKRLGKSRPAIANSMRLLALPEAVQKLVTEAKLQAGHCRVLASIPNDELLTVTAKQAAAQGWSVRETEQRVQQLLSERSLEKKQPKRSKLSNDMKQAQDSLRERLGTKVSFKGDDDKGKIVIEYFSREELSGIYDVIMGRRSED